jgi:hypothetical protein
MLQYDVAVLANPRKTLLPRVASLLCDIIAVVDMHYFTVA